MRAKVPKDPIFCNITLSPSHPNPSNPLHGLYGRRSIQSSLGTGVPRVIRRMKRRFDIETEDLPNARRIKNYKLVHQPQTNLLKQTQFIRNVELKNYDHWQNFNLDVPDDETWHAGFLLNGIGQGVLPWQRIGRKVTMHKIQLRYYFGSNVSGNGVAKFRILIVYDKQFNGAIPLISQVLDIHIAGKDPVAFNNLGNSDRFVTVADIITESALSFYDVPFGLISRNVNMDTIFNAGTGSEDPTTINTGGVILYVCQCLVPLVSPNNIQFNSRIRYSDN